MAKHRAKEEKLKRIRLGSRYFGFNLGQFYWQCLKVVAASEERTETHILRRIIGSWTETLPTAIQEKARAESSRLEEWKAQERRSRKEAKLQAKLIARRTRPRGGSVKVPKAGGTARAIASRTHDRIAVANSSVSGSQCSAG
jgi:hypothetical protein